MAPRDILNRVATRLPVLAVMALPVLPLASAHAEIYRWVDTTGSVTFSDKPPPKGVQVTDVIHVDPALEPSPQAIASQQAAHDSEMRVLNARMRVLELEIERNRLASAAAPPPEAPAPYVVAAAPPCDAARWDCGAPGADAGAYGGAVFLWGDTRVHGHRQVPGGHRPFRPHGTGSVAFIR